MDGEFSLQVSVDSGVQEGSVGPLCHVNGVLDASKVEVKDQDQEKTECTVDVDTI